MWTEMHQALISLLSPDYPWKDRLLCLPEVDSTNDQLKALARQGAPHGTALLADHQTSGHGRMGRSFQSPSGMGIYLSLLLRPQCSPLALMHLTCATAVAMCDALACATGVRPGIKWTNDLVFGTRKLGGILTELSLTPQGLVDYAIVGIGINCCQEITDFPPQLQSMAGSLAMVAGHPVSRPHIAAAVLEALAHMDQILLTEQSAILQRYREDCITLGREISILRGDVVLHGTALDVDASGALVVRYDDGTIQSVNSGEVSIRGMYGYV